MKTSTLLLLIIQNEGKLEAPQFGIWLRKLIELGYIEKDATMLRLSSKGIKHLEGVIK